MANVDYIVDLFEEVVDNIRQKGTVASSSESSGTYTILSENELLENWHVTIDSVDYKISNVSSSGFTISGETGIDFTGQSWKAKEPYYDFDHILGTQQKLTTKDLDRVLKFQKFPLILLLLDVEEDKDKNKNFGYEFGCRVLMLAKTLKDYTSQQRYTNVFKPVLYPIYNDLITEMKIYKHFYNESRNLLPHKKTDRVFWGSESNVGNTATVLNDYLDAIELNFESIKVSRKTNKCL